MKYRDIWGLERSRNPWIDEFKEYEMRQKKRSRENGLSDGLLGFGRMDDQYPYEKGWIFLLTPMFPGGAGSVQVAGWMLLNFEHKPSVAKDL
jgi:hypothetical protein